ncbi:hypothetical protein [Microcoleus sp. S13C4]
MNKSSDSSRSHSRRHLYLKRSPQSKLKQPQSENHCIGLIAG